MCEESRAVRVADARRARVASRSPAGPAIEWNPEFQRAFELMEGTSRHLFVTGRAGTGKSTLLNLFRERTKKKVAVLAPTGVAAVNIRGQTIHSFFGFRPDVTPDTVRRIRIRNRTQERLYRELDTLLIDEASMVRADLLDCVEAFLRLHGPKRGQPFGGVQMLYVGDLYQLPPVVTGQERVLFRTRYKSPYFFAAEAFRRSPVELVELEKVYRQRDDAFLRILNAVRNLSVTGEHLAALNARLDPAFEPAERDGLFVHLTPTNVAAATENDRRLIRLPGRLFRYDGEARGEFAEGALPADLHLAVKVGAQVMLLNNDSRGRWVNGTVGRITAREAGGGGEPDTLVVQLADGQAVDVVPYTWEMFRFVFDEAAGRLESEVVGTFTQYPLMLAWAVTIHKSQGKTFERVIIDMGRGAFAHGQTYVALSRCTTLAGIVLKKPIEQKHILLDWRIVKFLTAHQYQASEERLPLTEKVARIEQAIREGKCLRLVYLKSSDEKSVRVVRPEEVGAMEYEGKEFLGLRGYCLSRKDTRVFRVDRILKLSLHHQEA